MTVFGSTLNMRCKVYFLTTQAYNCGMRIFIPLPFFQYPIFGHIGLSFSKGILGHPLIELIYNNTVSMEQPYSKSAEPCELVTNFRKYHRARLRQLLVKYLISLSLPCPTYRTFFLSHPPPKKTPISHPMLYLLQFTV